MNKVTLPRRRALLVALDETPLGEVRLDGFRVTLPFQGWLLLADHMPARVSFTAPEQTAFVRFHEAAWIEGRIAGLPEGVSEAKLLLSPNAAHGLTELCLLERDGSFQAGPLPAGPVALQLVSAACLIAGMHRGLKLIGGHNYVGDIPVHRLGAVEFQFFSSDRPPDTGYFSWHFTDYAPHVRAAPGPLWPYNKLHFDAQGLATASTVPVGSLAGIFWTMSGHFAIVKPFQHGSDRTRVDLHVSSPGSLDFTLEYAGQVPIANCTLVLCDDGYGRSADECLSIAKTRRVLRCRTVRLGSTGRVRMDGLWPIGYRWTLLSPAGIPTLDGRCEVKSRSVTTVLARLSASRAGLRLINPKTAAVLRVFLTSESRGLLFSGSLKAGEAKDLHLVPPGSYSVLTIGPAGTRRYRAKTEAEGMTIVRLDAN